MPEERIIHRWRRKSRYQIRMMLFKHLLDYPFGATVSQLSRDLKLSRIVIREEINILLYEMKLVIHQVGNCRLYLRRKFDKSRRIKC
jgi:hypothetical protein